MSVESMKDPELFEYETILVFLKYTSFCGKTRKMPNSIKDGFFHWRIKKVTQKVNLGWRPMPDTCPDIAILKDGIFSVKKKKKKKEKHPKNELKKTGSYSCLYFCSMLNNQTP